MANTEFIRPPYIAEQLQALAVPINTLKEDPRNARTHGEPDQKHLKKSLERYGQRKPIVVRQQTRQVIAGNGTLKAAKALGWDFIAAVMVKDDARTAQAYAIADNRTADLSSFDDKQLATLVAELAEEADGLIDSIGFEDYQVERLLTRFRERDEDDGTDGPDTGDGEEGDKVGTRHVKLTYAAPDFDRYQAAVDCLMAHYGTTNAEDTLLAALGAHVRVLKAKEAGKAAGRRQTRPQAPPASKAGRKERKQ